MEAINNEIIKYYLKGEMFSNIIKLFDITYSDLIKILSEEFKSNKTINGFKKAKDLEYLNFLQTFDIENFLKDVKKLSRKQLGNKYNLTPTLINKLKLEFQINYLNATEAKKSNYIETYGYVEKGMELERKKAGEHTNQEEKLKKIQQTNLMRYQSISPFGNKEVRNKSVNT